MDSPQLQRCQCGATWIGHQWQRCNYCATREALRLEDKRKQLLYPDWLEDQGPRYWEMDEESQHIWKATRGLRLHDDVLMKWGIALEQAEADGVITKAEVLGAKKRWDERK